MSRFTLIMLSMLALGCSEYDLKSGAGEDDVTADEDLDSDGDSDEGGPDVPGDFDGSIRGRVCDPGGGWVVGAYVYTTYDSTGDGEHDARAEDETDENGAFELTGLPTDTEYIVYVIKGSFEATFDVVVAGGVTEIPEEECMLEPPDIAVLSGDYDHIEDIIGGMGLEYTLYNGQLGATEYLDFLLDPAAMAEFDIIFFNCGVSADWMYGYREEVRMNIREFVNNGGSIYTSDWAYYFVEAAFPAKIEFYSEDTVYGSAQMGASGSVTATVLDPSMEVIIGSATADINFDLDMWVVMEGVDAGVDILLQADVPTWDTWGGGMVYNSPIAVRFNIGAGRVLYTAFHNEHAATTLDMTDILEEIILSL